MSQVIWDIEYLLLLPKKMDRHPRRGSTARHACHWAKNHTEFANAKKNEIQRQSIVPVYTEYYIITPTHLS
jgi:hypothetical protein